MAIECHHNETANYIVNNYSNNQYSDRQEYMSTDLRSYIFQFIQKDIINEEYFCLFCKFDYNFLVYLFLTNDINVNKTESLFIAGPYDATPLYFAVEEENIEIITLLPKNIKIDVNIKGSDNLYTNTYKKKTYE